MRASLLLALPLVAALICAACSAAAQSRDEVAAEALFRAGRAAFVKARYAEAHALFKESFRLEPTPGTLLNIAICEEELGQLASAWQRYQGVLDALSASDERAAIARARLTRLEPRVPLLTLRLAPGAPKGTTLQIGTTALGSASFGLALPMDPGKHVLVAMAPGHDPRRFVVQLHEGQRRELVIHPGSVRTPAADKWGRKSTAEPSSRRTLGYWFLGAGAAGLTAGLVATGFAADRAATVDTHCRDEGCDDTGLDASSQGKRLTAVAIYCFAIGAAGLASGAYLMLSTAGPDPPNATGKAEYKGGFVSVVAPF
jgi:hypothetical protein